MEENEFNFKNEEQPPKKNYDWLKYVPAIIAAGFCVPLIGIIYDYVPKLLIAAAAAVLIVLIIRAMSERDKGIAVMKASDPQKVELCSDIKSLSFDISGGTFVINQGLNFSINGTDEKNFRSYIKNGVWHFESVNKSRIINPSADEYPITITLPQNFNSKKTSINLMGGRLLIYGMSAYNASVRNTAGVMDIRNLYAQKLDISCIEGDTRANAKTNGDVNINCTKGRLGIQLNCYPDSLDYDAKARSGKITIDDAVTENGTITADHGAGKKLSVLCEKGDTIVKFRQEAVNNA